MVENDVMVYDDTVEARPFVWDAGLTLPRKYPSASRPQLQSYVAHDGSMTTLAASINAVTAVRVLFAGVVQQLLGCKSREPSLPVAPLEPARNKKDGERNNLRRADQLPPHAPPVPDPRMGFRKRAQAHVSSCPRCNLQTQCSESHIEAFLSAPAPCPPFFISHPDNTIASSLPVADAPSRLVVRLISDCCLVGISAHEPGLWAAVSARNEGLTS